GADADSAAQLTDAHPNRFLRARAIGDRGHRDMLQILDKHATDQGSAGKPAGLQPCFCHAAAVVVAIASNRKTGIPGAAAASSASVEWAVRPSTNRPTSQPHRLR